MHQSAPVIFRLFGLLIVISLTRLVQAQENPLARCQALLSHDTLRVCNDQLEARYHWNGGNLILLSLRNRQSGADVSTGGTAPDLFLSEAFSTVSDGTLETTAVPADEFTQGHLRVDIHFRAGGLEIRRQLTLFPGIAAIRSTYYFRGQPTASWTVQETAGSLEMLEKPSLPADETPVTMGVIPLPGNHWRIRTVHFMDATDHHNNLVQEQEHLAFRKPLRAAANLLFARNLLSGQTIGILKEAPGGFSQQAYPGFDFQFSQQAVQVSGLGLAPEHVSAEGWTESYSYVVLLAGSEEAAALKTLRQYQKATRIYTPARDAMRVVNTWGDRSQDSRMNEKFITAEIRSAARLGLTHVQLDDGWQAGLSKNSAFTAGKLWDQWTSDNWQPHPKRFPKGFAPVVKEARKHGIRLGLWFNPSKADCYEHWERDADLLIDYYRKYDFRVFKIDGLELACKASEERLQKLFEKVLQASQGQVSFNLDVTAGRRPGFHAFSRYGNIFLENRYTDWGNYYPYWTLRNLWQLSRYVPAERLQIEFLNKWRNAGKYPAGDPLAPAALPFEYLVAITLMAQPLAWLETSSLPEKAFGVSELLKTYDRIAPDLHAGVILPVGHEPDGTSWTGFQSIHEGYGYLLIFREYTPDEAALLSTFLPPDTAIRLEKIAGQGTSFSTRSNARSEIRFSLSGRHSFALYRYTIE
jgi:alpha-galactosidase